MGKFHTDLFPSRTSGNKIVFDYLLDEIFAIYWSLILCFILLVQPDNIGGCYMGPGPDFIRLRSPAATKPKTVTGCSGWYSG